MKMVLVTGGSGFLGSWCVIDLLRRGYRVRATVRDLSREAALRGAIASEVDAGDRLSVLAADLRAMALFDPAIRSIVGQLGRRTEISSEKARTLLGWSPRPIQETIVDCAQSLIDQGVVKQAAR